MDTLIQFIHKDFLNPDKAVGALFYGGVFLVAAMITTALLHTAVKRVLKREQHHFLDPTIFSFVTQLLHIAVYLVFLILYMHLIPALHTLATAILTGVSVGAIVFGMAAQSTLGNLVAGVAVIFYRPFHIGDTVQVAAPAGNEIGIVERISLGYTVLVTADQKRIMVPNSVVLGQTTVNLTHVIKK